MIPELVEVNDYNGEWAALYYNGKKVLEGHSLDTYDVLKFLQSKQLLEYKRIEDSTEDRFPDKLEDICGLQ